MGRAIGEILPMAIGVAISPIPIIAIVLMLGTPRARSTGPAFERQAGSSAWRSSRGRSCSWSRAATPRATAAALRPGRTSSGSPSAFSSSCSRCTRGAAGRHRPGGRDAEVDAVDRRVHRRQGVRPRAALSGLNPKNLALTVAAATAIAQAGVSNGQEAGALIVFIVLGSITILAPLVIYFAMGSEGGAHPRRAEGVDGRPQRGDNDRAAARAGREADRRRDRRLQLVTTTTGPVPAVSLEVT